MEEINPLLLLARWSQTAGRIEQQSIQNKRLLRLDLMEGTQPAIPAVVAAMQAAVAQMGCKATFRASGPFEGHRFLREAIAQEYAAQGLSAAEEGEVFVTAGGRDGPALQLCRGKTVLLPELCSPAWLSGLAEARVIRLPLCSDGLPLPPKNLPQADIICLEAVGWPHGAAFDAERLEAWVSYALRRGSLLLYDSSCRPFLLRTEVPCSIYALPGARSCAVELVDFAPAYGLGGVCCGYQVFPRELSPGGAPLREWLGERQGFEACRSSYVAQRGAAALFTQAGRRQAADNRALYSENAAFLARALKGLGASITQGRGVPWLWVNCPEGKKPSVWFEELLELGVAVWPGDLFGEAGEGRFAASAFGGRSALEVAVKRMAATGCRWSETGL